ncbi:MAG: ABC transporter permease [Ruminiclostridium sp.]|nr:ABC transporter permease [Ruminiclostridium sp.]
MSKSFYFKLAAENIKKNSKTYIPFMLTCIITIAMFYIILSLSGNPGIAAMRGASFITIFMSIGSVTVGIFAVIFLFYTNSFLIKRRKKEFGLYNILGMEKRHISAVVFIEIFYTAAISLIIGLPGGILLDKLMYLIISRLLNVEVTLGFYVSVESLIASVIFFGAIFFFIFLNTLRQICFSNPIELLKGESMGEREPKTRWLMTVLGVGCLGAGYYISVTTRDIASAFMLFFLAVILVILGTYMLFTAGSVFILKTLRKNKRYYYKTKHFISVSGLIYRMKQNAAGLANICILSTMVLVMISSTSCLMMGMDEILKENFPYDLTLEVRRAYWSEDSEEKLSQFDEAVDIITEYEKEISRADFLYVMDFVGYFQDGKVSFEGTSSPYFLCFVTAEDYNKAFGGELVLKKGEIAAAPLNKDDANFNSESINLFGIECKIKEKADYFYAHNGDNNVIAEKAAIILSDIDAMHELSDKYREFYEISESGYRGDKVININFTANDEKRHNAILSDLAEKTGDFVLLTSRADGKYNFLDLYGGLFFLGLFLGTLFIMAAVLIIYYKQISEGYDDKKRFEIMQNVGLSKGEVRASIHSQVLTVFFLPLVMAGIHMTAAFPILKSLLEGMGMTKTWLFLSCTAVSFLVFAVFYIVVYLLTARSYYKIVSRG